MATPQISSLHASALHSFGDLAISGGLIDVGATIKPLKFRLNRTIVGMEKHQQANSLSKI